MFLFSKIQINFEKGITSFRLSKSTRNVIIISRSFETFIEDRINGQNIDKNLVVLIYPCRWKETKQTFVYLKLWKQRIQRFEGRRHQVVEINAFRKFIFRIFSDESNLCQCFMVFGVDVRFRIENTFLFFCSTRRRSFSRYSNGSIAERSRGSTKNIVNSSNFIKIDLNRPEFFVVVRIEIRTKFFRWILIFVEFDDEYGFLNRFVESIQNVVGRGNVFEQERNSWNFFRGEKRDKLERERKITDRFWSCLPEPVGMSVVERWIDEQFLGSSSDSGKVFSIGKFRIADWNFFSFRFDHEKMNRDRSFSVSLRWFNVEKQNFLDRTIREKAKTMIHRKSLTKNQNRSKVFLSSFLKENFDFIQEEKKFNSKKIVRDFHRHSNRRELDSPIVEFLRQDFERRFRLSGRFVLAKSIFLDESFSWKDFFLFPTPRFFSSTSRFQIPIDSELQLIDVANVLSRASSFVRFA